MFFLDATSSLATEEKSEKKYVKVIEDDICNMKIEFKAKSEIMKRNRNHKEFDKKIWRILKCKEIVALHILICTIQLFKVCIRR